MMASQEAKRDEVGPVNEWWKSASTLSSINQKSGVISWPTGTCNDA